MGQMILVTGGAGFIGSHVVNALIGAGYDVRVLDSRVGSPGGGRPARLSADAELITGDVCDPAVVARSLDGVGAVCHLAGMVGLGRDFGDVVGYVRDNDLGTAVLLQAMARQRPTTRLVLASSMVVYGEGRYTCPDHGVVAPLPRPPADLDAGRFDPACPCCDRPLSPAAVPESARLDPRSVYAATKLHQEHLGFALARETRTPVTALRYHNVYGPGMPRDTEYAGVAAIFTSALAGGRPPRVYEDGAQLRDFVHVRDVARATVLALVTPDPITGPLNIASGQPQTVGALAAAMATAVGGPSPVTTGEFRLGDVRHVFASVERAERELGFRAAEDFRDGMAELARAEMPPA